MTPRQALKVLVDITASEQIVYVVVSAPVPGYNGVVEDDPKTTRGSLVHHYYDTDCDKCVRKVAELKAEVFKSLGLSTYTEPSSSMVDGWLNYRNSIQIRRFVMRPMLDEED